MQNNTQEFKKKVARTASLYCKGRGISHKEIARRLSLSKSQIDNWFCHGTFTAKGIRVLTEDFGVPVEIFTSGEYKEIPTSSEVIAKNLLQLELEVKELTSRIDALEKGLR